MENFGFDNYVSQPFKTGKRGSPRKGPSRTVTIRMGLTAYSVMDEFCISKNWTQREFMETATELLVSQMEVQKKLVQRRASYGTGWKFKKPKNLKKQKHEIGRPSV